MVRDATPKRSENDLEAETAVCDICKEEVSVEELVECPPMSEKVRDGILYHYVVCKDCCKEVFETEGCQSDVGNCDRATELMRSYLKQYAEKRGFTQSEKAPDVYLSQSRVYCLGTYTTSPEQFFDDEETAEIDWHEGEEVLIVKFSDNLFSFSKDTINEILEIFDDLRCYRDVYRFLKNKKLLVIPADGVWSVLAPRIDPNYDYDSERNAFIGKIRDGNRFFNLNKDDGVVVLEYREMKFDWSRLDERNFVELCADILIAHPEMENVQITEGTHDLGQDIKAMEIVNDLLGIRKQKWTIQCKHFISRKVTESDIEDIANSHAQLKFDVLCLMTSNYVTPGCNEMLESWDKLDRYNFRTTIWDKTKIEAYLRNKPEIYTKYFV